MSATVRPIRILGAHALAALEARIRAGLGDWAAGWLRPEGHPPAPAVSTAQTPAPACDAGPPPFDRLESEHGSLWIRRQPGDQKALLLACLGDAFADADGRPVDAWVAAVVEACWLARNAALCEALFGPVTASAPGAPAESLYALGSGAVQIEASRIGLFAVADVGVLRHVPPRLGVPAAHERCVALDRAAARAVVGLTVSAGRVELALRTLLELRPGDVLRLPTRLDDTLALAHGASAPLRCAVGEAGGRAAIRLCPAERVPT